MMRLSMFFFLAGGAIVFPRHLLAQIVPDTTLPENSIVNLEGELQRITGGTAAGSNLFHSFEQLNIRTGETVSFETSPTIDNIMARITGGQLSNIDGLIRINGTANLFLLNPHGIVFGANARLDLGGSFVASSASSVIFADGSQFRATHPGEAGTEALSLLSIDVPVGLQFNSPHPGGISLSGAHLAVPTGQTLALVGGDLIVSGANLVAGGSPFVEIDGIPTATTPGGRIELGSVRDGEVRFSGGDTPLESLRDRSLSFNYANVPDLGNIQIQANADVDVTGTGGGDIQIVARNLQVSDGARVFSLTQGSQPGGIVTVRATESVELVGTGDFPQTIQQLTSADTTPFNLRVTGLFNVTLGLGNAGEITIDTPQLLARHNAAILNSTQGMSAGDAGGLTIKAEERVEVTTALIATSNGANATGNGGDLILRTPQLLLQDNGLVLATTLGQGRGGDLTVEAEEIRLSRAQPFPVNPILTFGTAIATGSLAAGDAGNLTIDARTIELSDSAQINSGTIGSGGSGNLTVNASESIDLRGGETVMATATPNNVFNTSMTTATVTIGDAGDVRLTTPRLILRDGAFVATETFGQGAGGTVDIHADVVELSGVSPNDQLPTAISARSINSFGGGNAGNVQIDTGQLVIRDGANLAVSSQGSGSAGNLEITATEIQLDGGELTASTANGEQGNITLNANTAILRNGSRITTNSTESATGGNIAIDTDSLVALENSDITANSQQNFGGRVDIITQSIFGTAFREALTDGSDITATGGSPELSGRVTIQTPEIEPGSAIVDLSSDTLAVDETLARSCLTPSSRKRGRFTIVGAGGLAPRPDETTISLFQTYSIPTISEADIPQVETIDPEEREEILEAEGIFQLEDDRFVLGRLCR